MGGRGGEGKCKAVADGESYSGPPVNFCVRARKILTKERGKGEGRGGRGGKRKEANDKRKGPASGSIREG